VGVLAALFIVPVMAQVPVMSPFKGSVTIGGVAAPVDTVIGVYVGEGVTLGVVPTMTVADAYELVVLGAAEDVG